MKTIKIFLASSEELENDRNAFGNLVRRLDKIYEKRGIRIELFEWEDYDAAFNGVRKQDEYNGYVRNSDMFLALFHKKAGKFTIEEFDIATEEFKKHASPKVYTYCKDLQPGEEESPELTEFKKRLFEELGHYWCRYDNNDSLQLHFVMQLQLVESSQSDALKVENGEVTLDGHHIASMDKLKFAAANDEYVKKSERLASLPKEIEGLRMTLLQLPDNEFLNNSLQEKLNEYNQLKEEFAKYQELLFNTAKRIAQMQGEYITDRMRRAMDAFDVGKIREANIILDEAEIDARRVLEDYRQSKEITEQKRQIVFNAIKELLLKTSIVMADASIPIEERIEHTKKIYAQADEMAGETEYDKEKYAKLLMDYGSFLIDYAKYDKAIVVYQRLIGMCGTNNKTLSAAYNNLGRAHNSMGDLSTAVEYYQKSIAIDEDADSLKIAASLNNIGDSLLNMEEYQNASEFLFKAMEIREQVLGPNHIGTAITYNNIGNYYYCLGDYAKALDYLEKYLSVALDVYGEFNLDTAGAYNNIGAVLIELNRKKEALEYYSKALKIRERIFGFAHDDTANSYHNIGHYYFDSGNYEEALAYFEKALKSFELVGIQSKVANAYSVIGDVYLKIGKRDNAIVAFAKAFKSYDKLIEQYQEAKNFQDALRYLDIALKLATDYKIEPVMGSIHSHIGRIYTLMGDKEKAKIHFQTAIDMLPEDAPEAIDSRKKIEDLK